ncbi:MAG: hypothetical protein F4213_06500 [Boseongicola sp. SB0677_bin_26]|nr:hypothetical protein [Boseongicola sp. SB0665_bin_10]MYG25660.1 hypothetical protein [Boseongicola sp. SB0677_bin_26]
MADTDIERDGLAVRHAVTRMRRKMAKPSGRRKRLKTLSGTPARGPALLLRRLNFGMKARLDVWQMLSDVVASGVAFDEAMDSMIEGFQLNGNEEKAKVLAEMRAAAFDGEVPDRMSRYITPPERLILEGLGTQEAHAVFGSAARLLKNRLAIRKAFNDAIAMPIVLAFSLLGLVLFFGYELLPALLDIIDRDKLPMFQSVVVDVTIGISRNPSLLFIVIGACVVVLALLMRFWTGVGRVTADRFPPFSIQRLQAGTGFLFAVTEYGRVGVAVTPELLVRMTKITPPYEASRIQALIPILDETGNLGEAGIEANQGFPDDTLSVIVRLLWNREGGIDKAGDFLERRLAQIEEMVRVRMAVLNGVLLVLVTFTLLSLMSVMMPVFEQLNSGAMP